MKIDRFEDMLIWQEARIITLEVYEIFKGCKDFSFIDQIQRASVSIMNNVSEGFERGSNKDFVRFLFIAKSSCAEVRSMLHLALGLKYIQKEEFDNMYNRSEKISKMISSLIKKL